MEITRRTDYAIRMLIVLSRLPQGRFVSAGEVARDQKVPYPLARGILSQLARAGFVTTRRGAGGGVTLARSPADITLLSIIETLEGPVALGLCTTDPDYCSQVDVCLMHGVWKKAEAQLKDTLAAHTLAHIAETHAMAGSAPRAGPTVASEGGEAVTQE